MTIHLRRVIAGLAVILGILCTGTTIARAGDQFLVSLHNPGIAPGERILAFEIRLKGAMFIRLRDIPWDWELVVTNFAAEPKLSGGTPHGAGALNEDFFVDFMTIESTGLAPISLSGELDVTRDFSDVRRISLQQPQFSLRKP